MKTLKHLWILGLCVLLVGCVTAKITNFVRYIASNDTYEILTIFQDIHDSDGGYSSHFAEFYANRDSLIIPKPSFPKGGDAWLRISDTQYKVFGFGGGNEDTVYVIPDGGLNDVKIAAGTLMFDKQGSLCYSHRTSIPGKIIDAAMKTEIDAATHKFAMMPNSEFVSRPVILTWEQFAEKPTFELDSLPISRESREMIMQYAKGSQFKVVREGMSFSFFVPLTDTDIQGALLLNKAIAKENKDPKNSSDKPYGLKVKADKGGVIFQIDYRVYLARNLRDEPLLATKNPDKKKESQINANVGLIEGLNARGRLIPGGFDAKEVLRKFSQDLEQFKNK